MKSTAAWGLRAILAVVIACGTLGSWAVSPVDAVTLTVPSGPFPTIQSALDAAVPGDIVKVKAGIYFENLTMVTPGVTLTGANCSKPGITIIDGSPGGVTTVDVITVGADFVTIKCLTAQFGSNGIMAVGEDLTVDKVWLIGNGRDEDDADDDANGINVLGPRFRLTNLFVQASEGDGIVGSGANGVVRNNTVRQSGAFCYFLPLARFLTLTNNIAKDCVGIGIGVGAPNVGPSTPDILVNHNTVSGAMACIVVLANNSRIEDNNCTGGSGTLGIVAAGNTTLAIDNTISGAVLIGLAVVGGGVVIMNNVITDVTLLALVGAGPAMFMERNTVRNSLGLVILALGSDSIVNKNTADNVALAAVLVVGNDATVTNNQLKNCLALGLMMLGHEALVQANNADGCQTAPFVIAGDAPTVIGNRASTRGLGNLLGIGYFVECTDDCSLGRVSNNRMDGNGLLGFGFIIDNLTGVGAGSGLMVDNNTASRNKMGGFAISGDGHFVDRNTATNNGALDGAFGIGVAGNNNIIARSTVSGGADDGINVVEGDANELQFNTVKKNVEDGLHIQALATNTIVTGNLADQNRGEGIQNDGTDTEIADNTSRRNRIDCAGIGTTDPAGTAADPASAGNVCQDGSTYLTGPEIEVVGDEQRADDIPFETPERPAMPELPEIPSAKDLLKRTN